MFAVGAAVQYIVNPSWPHGVFLAMSGVLIALVAIRSQLKIDDNRIASHCQILGLKYNICSCELSPADTYCFVNGDLVLTKPDGTKFDFTGISRRQVQIIGRHLDGLGLTRLTTN